MIVEITAKRMGKSDLGWEVHDVYVLAVVGSALLWRYIDGEWMKLWQDRDTILFNFTSAGSGQASVIEAWR